MLEIDLFDFSIVNRIVLYNVVSTEIMYILLLNS